MRIAGQISFTRKTAWQGAIVKYLTDPLKTEDERNVQELKAWYKSDTEWKELLEKIVREQINRLEVGLKVRKTKPINKKNQSKTCHFHCREGILISNSLILYFLTSSR